MMQSESASGTYIC